MNSMANSPAYCDPEILARLSSLSLRARQVVEGTISGQHRSPFHGFAVEFAEYREYSPGDDLRRLDWRVLARSDRFFVKQYEEESNVRVAVVLDASRSMSYGRSPMTKFDYAATLVASLATLLVNQQDQVGLALADTSRREWLVPSSTGAHLVELIRRLEAAKPGGETDLGAVLSLLAEQVGRKGMTVIVSDLFTDLDRFYDGLARLRHRGQEILLFHVLDRDEVEMPFEDLVLFKDIEGTEEFFAEPWAFRKAYKAAIAEFQRDVRDRCNHHGVDYVLLYTDQNLGDAMSRFWSVDYVLLYTDQNLGDAMSSYLHSRQRIQSGAPIR